MSVTLTALPGRFMARVRIDEHGCWIWTGGTGGKTGYGKFNVRVAPGQWRMVSTHRYAYEQIIGPVPDGMQLDHLCRVRLCCNPEHLEPVTRRVNQSRGIKGALTTHCPQGHPYDETNTLRRANGHRRCRTCHSQREAQRRAS